MLLGLWTLVLLSGLLGSSSVSGAGSGRAFPIDSENYVTSAFTRINPRLQWDPTNYLVDLAGHYANCNSIGTRGVVRVDHRTAEGKPIIGVVDYAPGTRSDVDAVNGYIQGIVDGWVRTGIFNNEIRGADRFGCSVRPGCSGQVSVSCLFSNSRASNIEIPPQEQPAGRPHALAFTPQQYQMAETITGNTWDRSHYLENLSGFETDCAMIDAREWSFAKASAIARDAGLRITGIYGYSPNRGSTPEALNTIMMNFKEIRFVKKIGCSVIPDCRQGRDMFVVVSCLYEETY